MGAAILIFLLLPFLQKFTVCSSKFDVLSQFFFWVFISDVILLG